MIPVPRDNTAKRDRVFGALCDDLFDLGAGRSTRFERVNAIREIERESSRE